MYSLKISEELHTKLQESARRRGLLSIEHLLEVWQTDEDERLWMGIKPVSLTCLCRT